MNERRMLENVQSVSNLRLRATNLYMICRGIAINPFFFGEARLTRTIHWYMYIELSDASYVGFT